MPQPHIDKCTTISFFDILIYLTLKKYNENRLHHVLGKKEKRVESFIWKE